MQTVFYYLPWKCFHWFLFLLLISRSKLFEVVYFEYRMLWNFNYYMIRYLFSNIAFSLLPLKWLRDYLTGRRQRTGVEISDSFLGDIVPAFTFQKFVIPKKKRKAIIYIVVTVQSFLWEANSIRNDYFAYWWFQELYPRSLYL